MGLTPLEGLVMGSRAGDLDVATIFHLHRVAGIERPGDVDDAHGEQARAAFTQGPGRAGIDQHPPADGLGVLQP